MRVRRSKNSSLLLLVKETEGSALSSDPPPPIVTVSQAFSLTTRFQNISKQDRARAGKGCPKSREGLRTVLETLRDRRGKQNTDTYELDGTRNPEHKLYVHCYKN